MRLRLLFNPTAGRGRARRHVGEAMEYLGAGGAEVECTASESPEHLTRLAAEASRDAYDRVVVCGGDGSVNLAVREFDLRRGVLAVVPLGSGDDFAQTVGISRNLREACDAILNGTIREIDVASANGQRYLGVAGVGFDSEVASVANEVKLLRGSLVYLYAILRVLPRFRPRQVRVVVDGRGRQEELMFAVVGNTHRYGAGILIVPPAKVDDGLLDLCLVRRCSRWELLKTLPMAYTGAHVKSDFVTLERGRVFEFQSDTILPVFADGESMGTTPTVIELLEEKLRVAVPAGLEDRTQDQERRI